MKRTGIAASIFVLLILGLDVAQLQAQGFAAILEKIDRLESRLNELEKDGSGQVGERLQALEESQQRQVAGIKAQLAAVPSVEKVDRLGDSLAELSGRVDRVSARLETADGGGEALHAGNVGAERRVAQPAR